MSRLFLFAKDVRLCPFLLLYNGRCRRGIAMDKRKTKIKIKAAWRWTRRNLLNRETLFFFALSEALFWFPWYGLTFIGARTGSAALMAFGSAWFAFWAVPITPAIPTQIALTFLLKGLWGKIKIWHTRKR